MKRPSLFSRLKLWHQILVFILAVSGTLGLFATVERQFGVAARAFGFLRADDLAAYQVKHQRDIGIVAGKVDELQSWQLFDALKRLQRLVKEMENKKGPLTRQEDNRLIDLKEQLRQTTNRYEQLERRRGEGR